MSKIVYLSLLLGLFVTCLRKETKFDGLQVIDLEQGVEKQDSVNITQIGAKIAYVPLETNDSIVLGNFEALVTESGIIALDYNSGIYLFDRKGKFIRKIGQKGQGPGEYGNVASVSIDEELREILVATDGKEELMKFSYDGTYSKFVDISSSQSFVFHNDILFAHKASVYFWTGAEDSNQLTVYDVKGNILNQFHPVDFNKTKYLDMFIEDADFSISEDKVFYYVVREDIIYNVTQNSLNPFYALNLGKFSFQQDYKWDYNGYSNARKGNKIWIVSSFVTESYVFFLVEQTGKRRVVVYDKKADKVYNRLTNDIDCVPITYLSEIYGNKIVTSLSVADLLECDNKESFPKDLKAILRELKEDDNPVLRIVTLK